MTMAASSSLPRTRNVGIHGRCSATISIASSFQTSPQVQYFLAFYYLAKSLVSFGLRNGRGRGCPLLSLDDQQDKLNGITLYFFSHAAEVKVWKIPLGQSPPLIHPPRPRSLVIYQVLQNVSVESAI